MGWLSRRQYIAAMSTNSHGPGWSMSGVGRGQVWLLSVTVTGGFGYICKSTQDDNFESKPLDASLDTYSILLFSWSLVHHTLIILKHFFFSQKITTHFQRRCTQLPFIRSLEIFTQSIKIKQSLGNFRTCIFL